MTCFESYILCSQDVLMPSLAELVFVYITWYFIRGFYQSMIDMSITMSMSVFFQNLIIANIVYWKTFVSHALHCFLFKLKKQYLIINFRMHVWSVMTNLFINSRRQSVRIILLVLRIESNSYWNVYRNFNLRMWYVWFVYIMQFNLVLGFVLAN